MTGKVNDGDHVTVELLGQRAPAVGDIALVRCRGHEYLHTEHQPRALLVR